jgi:two-component system response regulator PilR (NtrC family)
MLLGESTVMENIRTTIRKISRSQAPVHISGASGSGKELAAKQIHDHSSRRDAPFIAINCGAIPKELVESEFFGYKKGSFSGATTDKKGLFQAADQGTLFLDEVADLPMDMQVKLLRAIQEKKIRPIGSNIEEEVDIRILSATHKNLKNEVTKNNFREDLFFRINVIPLSMPTLSEHPEDIEVLSESILKKLDASKTLSQEALTTLKRYSFPGNVRELENILERACAMCESHIINQADLHLEDNETSFTQENHFNVGSDSITNFLEQTEKEAILSALKKTNGNKTNAAKLLGISFRSLRYKLTKIDNLG